MLIEQNNTCEIVQKPKNVNILDALSIFSCKYLEENENDKYKQGKWTGNFDKRRIEYMAMTIHLLPS